MDSLGKRFSRFREYTKLSQVDFAKKVGVAQSNLTQWETNKNRPNAVKLNKIKVAFPELNINWLITGEGEMLNQVKKSDTDDILRKEITELREKNKILEERLKEMTDKLIKLYEEIANKK